MPLSLKGLFVSSIIIAPATVSSGALLAKAKLEANFSKKKLICKPGFRGFFKIVMAIPFALAEVFMTLGAILHFLFYLIGALLSSIVFLASYVILFLVATNPGKTMSLWEFSRYLFKHSADWFDYLGKLNSWYNGNC